MLRSWRNLALCGCGLFFVVVSVSALAADEFAAPPKAERDVVAAIGKGGGRITVDGEYRVTGVSLTSGNTNDDLKALAACERLTTISIAGAKITDDGLVHLHRLKKLTSIAINGSGTSAESVAALQAALPDCRVTSFGRAAPAPGAAVRPVFGGPGGAAAGDRGPGGRTGGFSGSSSSSRTMTLLRNVSVQDDLRLTAEQQTQISEATSNTAVSAAMKLIDEKVLAVLTPEQKARVKQLEL